MVYSEGNQIELNEGTIFKDVGRFKESLMADKHPGGSNDQELFPLLGMKEREDRAVSRTKLLGRGCDLPRGKATTGNQSPTWQEPGL